jgi:cytoskeletal protein RodZ
MGVFGDTLRQARAHKGVTLREAEQATRISRHYLLALEEEHFDQLPALIYQRGIVKNYASYLDLDQSKLLRSFQDATGEPEPAIAAVIGSGQAIEPAGGIVPNFAVIGFIVVMMGVIFAWGYSAYVATPNDTSLTQSPPTVTRTSDDDRFIPSPTPVSPTVTREVDIEPASNLDAEDAADDETVPDGEIVLATLTATAEPVEITFGGSGDENAAEGDGSGELSLGTDDSALDGTAEDRRFSFYSETDITLTVVVDNVVQWEGNLAAGSETSYLSGDSFLVTFSGTDVLYAVDGTGESQEITGPTAEIP